LAIPDRKSGYFALLKNCDCKLIHQTIFSEKLKKVLGFKSEVIGKTFSFNVHKSGKSVTALGSQPSCLSRAIPNQLYVYTDICEPYTVGDSQSALLRIVPINNSRVRLRYYSGSICTDYYIPVLTHNFQTIVIDIRDEHGDPISFEYGTLTVTLHFKRNL